MRRGQALEHCPHEIYRVVAIPIFRSPVSDIVIAQRANFSASAARRPPAS
jgi:hypothetical protein